MYNLVWLNSCCARAQTSCPYTSKNKIFTMCNFQQFEELWKKIKEKKKQITANTEHVCFFFVFHQGKNSRKRFQGDRQPSIYNWKEGQQQRKQKLIVLFAHMRWKEIERQQLFQSIMLLQYRTAKLLVARSHTSAKLFFLPAQI